MEIAISRNVSQFAEPESTFQGMPASAVATALAAASDLTLVLDRDGVVRDLAFGSPEMYAEGFEAWRGRSWIDTVTIESRHKVEEMLRDAALQQPTRWREVNHPHDGHPDVPVRYSVVQAIPNGGYLAFGRDLRTVATLQQKLVEAQIAVERDYARIRQSELRYRLLFQVIAEPVIIVDAATGRIVEVNPAANRLLAQKSDRFPDELFINLFAESARETVLALLASVRSLGHAQAHSASLRTHGNVSLSASLFRQANTSQILVRMLDANSETCGEPPNAGVFPSNIADRLTDAFVLTDQDARLVSCNAAFLDLVQAPSEAPVKNQRLDSWIGRSSVDVNVLVQSLRDTGAVRSFQTVATGVYRLSQAIDIAAAAVPDATPPGFAFVIRPIMPPPVHTPALPKSVEQLTELVGRVPLKDLVRETSDLIEKLCIQAALELTKDNRASAAELLGLSRQSLYVKLRRYGLHHGDEAE